MDREVITKSEVAVEEERGNGGGISRRTFLKGAGGVAAAAAVLGLSGLKSKVLAQSIPASVSLPKKTMLEMYRRMQCIRQGEKKLQAMYVEGGRSFGKWVPGIQNWCHQSVGQEATCVGAGMAMEKGDVLTGSHRSHGYPLGLGLDLKRWMAEFFVKDTGTQHGIGGSMHICDAGIGMAGMSGIVGGNVSHVVGMAIANQIKGNDRVAIATFGDGSMNTSGVCISFNMAKIYDAPCVFLLDNNKWQIGVPNYMDNALAKQGKDLSVRAAGFGLPGITVDGMDVFAVYSGMKYCIDRARQGNGPTLIESVEYRFHGHGSPGAHECTRWPHERPEELEYWLMRDPIKRFERQMLRGELITAQELKEVKDAVTAELEEALDFALKSPLPDAEKIYQYYSDLYSI